MNINVLRPLAAALVIAASAQATSAELRGEHPAVLVSRSWSKQGVDPNTFIVQHPAGHVWVSQSPSAKRANAKRANAEPTLLPVKTASVTTK